MSKGIYAAISNLYYSIYNFIIQYIILNVLSMYTKIFTFMMTIVKSIGTLKNCHLLFLKIV